jgi:alginate O-acetyltransferase complex protein AlgI
MFKDYIDAIFTYNEKHPLIFTQFYFWAFFLVVLIFYSFLANSKNKTIRSGYLFLASLFFYYKSSGFFFFILIFSTLVDFFIGKEIARSQRKIPRQLLLATSILVNLSLLSYFKYAYFFVDSFNSFIGADYQVINHLALIANNTAGTHFNVGAILLPVGISFFTFQTISYSVDVYRGHVAPVKNLIDFGFYVSFFPQLVAGPIVRASEFIPQLYKPYNLSKFEFGLAIWMILKGLVKKIFIGDYIAVNFIDRVFTNHLSYTGFENLMSLYGYSLQVYCDFSGYTDIAIGVALLMGFRLRENFNSPYKAKNTGEFWQRWHISLSSWLKDYLYIPMGGNRNGSVFTWISLTAILAFIILIAGELVLIPLMAGSFFVIWLLTRIFPPLKKHITTNINILLTMLLGGLWHGSSWMFIIWGGLNGLGVIFYKYWRKISPWEKSTHMLATVWKIFLTFNFITFTRIWFRGESMQGTSELLHQIANDFQLKLIPDIVMGYKWVFLMMLFGFILHWWPSRLKEKYMNWFIATPLWAKVMISALIVFVIYQSISADMQPFIYFQF